MKRVLSICLLLGLLVSGFIFAKGNSEKSSTSGAVEANYPTRPVTLIIAFGAGGGSDVPARMIQPYVEENLGVPVNVINVVGASGWVGWEKLLADKADGYTVAMINLPTIYSGYLNPELRRKVTIEDFTMIGNQVTDSSILVVKKGDPRFPTAKAYIEYAKANEVTVGTAGMGSDDSILVNSITQGTDLKLTMVPGNGWKDGYAALLGNHIDSIAANVGEALTAYADGEVDILCVFAEKRSAFFPDIKTWNELKLGKPFTSASDRGYAVRKGTPQAYVDRLEAAFKYAINKQEGIDKLKTVGMEIVYMDAKAFTKYAKQQEDVIAGMSKVMGWTK